MSLPMIPSRVVLAPMAGGPGTPELVAAVSDAGGFGFLPSGYLSLERFAQDLARLRSLTSRSFGVNVFVPAGPDAARLAAAEAYAERVAAWARPSGLPTAGPVYTDDEFQAKVDLLLRQPPAAVSFAFGVPDEPVVEAFRRAKVAVMVTVTTPEEAALAERAGADALVVQGAEAGAHQGGWLPVVGDPIGLLPLLQLVTDATTLPVVAAGGIATGGGIAAVLALGAEAAMLGTAFLRCTEAGTSSAHATALGEAANGTTLTRAFTGRSARAIRNEFVEALGQYAPAAYPEVHMATAPLRVEARRRGDAQRTHLWAGQAFRLSREIPAAQLLEELVQETRRASERGLTRSPARESG